MQATKIINSIILTIFVAMSLYYTFIEQYLWSDEAFCLISIQKYSFFSLLVPGLIDSPFGGASFFFAFFYQIWSVSTYFTVLVTQLFFSLLCLSLMVKINI